MNPVDEVAPVSFRGPETEKRNVDSTKKTNDTRLLLPHNKTTEGNVSLSGTDTVDGLDNIGDLFSQMMNGAVDVEKNPWIFFIQGNYEIAPMILFLLKAGVPKEHAIMFVSNPLVIEYAKQQRIIKGAYAKMTGKIDENFPDTKTKFQAAVNALETAGIKNGGSLVSAAKYYDAAVNATSKSGILNELRRAMGSLYEKNNSMAIGATEFLQTQTSVTSLSIPGKFYVAINCMKLTEGGGDYMFTGVSSTNSQINAIINLGTATSNAINAFLVANYDAIFEIDTVTKQVNYIQ